MSQSKVGETELTEYQREQLHSIAKWADKMDGQWSILGFSVGWDAILGLLPVAGDTLTACVSLNLVNKARKMQAPKRLLVRMLANIAIDMLGGALPLVGDVFDLGWRANTKNLHLLEQHYGINALSESEAEQHGGLALALISLLILTAVILGFVYQQALYEYFV